MSTDEPVAPDVLDEVVRAIARLESHADPEVRETVARLLAGIDAVHRAGLTHLAQAIHSMAGDAFLNRLVADPAIRLLLMSYNLVAVDRRLMAEEALDAVRGHLHDHGIDVETLEVVGGVVYVRLHRSSHTGELQDDAVRRDLEAALRDRFVGFQELVLRERTGAEPPAVVPMDALRRARRPVYHDVAAVETLPPGALAAVRAGSVPLLLVNVDGDIHAVRNQCGDAPLPLEFSTLEGALLTCSWHGCRYDVRSGHRVDGPPGRLQVFPVSVEDGRVRVALDVAAVAGIGEELKR
jgi:nitrite reductase/ring-hydroxylating ferredoxin subunit